MRESSALMENSIVPNNVVTAPRGGLLITVLAVALLLLLSGEQNQEASLSLPLFVRGGPHGAEESSAPALATAAAADEAWSDSMLYSRNFASGLEKRHARAAAGVGADGHGNGYAFATAGLQSLIRRAQFPASCSDGRFLVSHGNGRAGGMGLGALLHVAAIHLGVAVSLGRTFVWHSDVLGQYADAETCHELRGIACFLRAPSSCTLEQALASGADTVHVEQIGAGAAFGLNQDFVPPEALLLLSTQGDTPDMATELESILTYMWRAQCTSFLMLLNDKTIADLRVLRLLSMGLNVQASTESSAAELLASLRIPPPLLQSISPRIEGSPQSDFPLRGGTISVHIRHGDKSTEMALVPTGRYLDAAVRLQHDMALGLVQQIFVSTEDPTALLELNKTLMSQPQSFARWIVRFSELPRANSNGDHQLDVFSRVPRARLTQLWLLQLLMALECDAWVGTRKSNWNRLIDELRCVWVPKCGLPFIEVGPPHLGW